MSDINDFFDNDFDNPWGSDESNTSSLDETKESKSVEETDFFSNDIDSDNSTLSDSSDDVKLFDDSLGTNDSDNSTSSDSSDDVKLFDDSWGTDDSDNSWFDNSETNENQQNWTEDNKTTDNKWKNDFSDEPLQENAEEEFKKKFNFNYKQAALIVAGGFILLALLFFGISKIHITRNTSSQQQQLKKEVNQVQQSSTGSQTLLYVPSSTDISYDSNIITSNGKIKSKEKYLLGNQLLYDLSIELPTGTQTVILHYYCTKDTFDKVYKDTEVIVDYQVASDNYYSIKNVKTN